MSDVVCTRFHCRRAVRGVRLKSQPPVCATCYQTDISRARIRTYRTVGQDVGEGIAEVLTRQARA